VLKCFVSLSNRSREEDLEDLYYYMIESFQLSGVPVSLDEIDMDQVVCDLKTALDDFHTANTKVGDNPDQHTFLVLDKAFQAFPWESMPCLRGRSVSRIPSLAFLRDRLDLARVRQETELPAMPHRITVNTSQTAVILNPGGDLKTTQQAFEPWVQRMQKSGWSSIVGRAPSEEEMRQCLSNKDLVL
jgi:separase